jgi:hypothetical protein
VEEAIDAFVKEWKDVTVKSEATSVRSSNDYE